MSLIETSRVFRRRFEITPKQPLPSDNGIRTWINNLKQNGLTSEKRDGSARTVRNPENIERVRQTIQKSQIS